MSGRGWLGGRSSGGDRNQTKSAGPEEVSLRVCGRLEPPASEEASSVVDLSKSRYQPRYQLVLATFSSSPTYACLGPMLRPAVGRPQIMCLTPHADRCIEVMFA